MESLIKILLNKPVAAAVRRLDDMEEVLRHPNINAIFLLGGDINSLPPVVKRVRTTSKLLFIHIDLLEGIGKDRAGIHLLKRMGVHGIVTTKGNLVKYAREEGLYVIQRVFIVDSESVKTAIKVAENIKPHAVEILPATIPSYVISDMKKALGLPVLGGGLLKTEEDLREALDKGFDAISTSLRFLWNVNV
ncbi:glycerol-3-phosphate responsive antiterminator [Desulforamulus hydrothermalis]|uniref:Putative anti-terminator regulatory protein n=1 Tax=Desulforamulus hydrothermalis Lam5 = DSM 18033 TaxID=1121428 RepID=K8DZS1_9FIRM|nr:glycerol-3-phosphate responsive antiterminator [Desulforamulus hydrothermalis]CCO08642.1 putative anti-terminator regulatory protein [Desulforamulus hydrothermalis Lam5 = DSM 18033]SHH00474.1 glycerol uptake operon antiterminator [Desulforamulus hydrothermalis Lam5 = DSM 18033]